MLSFLFSLPLLCSRGRVFRLHVLRGDVLSIEMEARRCCCRRSSLGSAAAARPRDEDDQKQNDDAEAAEAEQQPLPPRRGALRPSSQTSSAVARAVGSRELVGTEAAAAEAVARGSSLAEHVFEMRGDRFDGNGKTKKMRRNKGRRRNQPAPRCFFLPFPRKICKGRHAWGQRGYFLQEGTRARIVSFVVVLLSREK